MVSTFSYFALSQHTASHVTPCFAGAGPLGPFIQAPIPPGGPEQMGMGVQMGNGLPRGGSRGPARIPRAQSGGRGGFGGGPMPMGGRGYGGRGGYYDLDAPENQRGVLDYGDL